LNDDRTKHRAHPKRNAGGRGPKAPEADAGYPEKPGLRARQAAAKILAAVVDRRTPLDGMLDFENGNPAYRQLNDADRALVRAILNTALRHLPRIDAIMDTLVGTPLPEGARALHHVLTVAAAQILYLDVPDHSAVDLAVEQAQIDPRNRRFASLTNAVLRRLGREKASHLSATHGVSVIPPWFQERLVAIYGREHTARINDALLEPSTLDLTVKSDPDLWAARLGGLVLPTGSVRLPVASGAIPALEGFEAGEWWVQDAAASLPAKLFRDLAGKRVADLCAAPGGKTAQLAAAGAVVTALDQSSNRLKRLVGNLERLGLSATVVEANMADYRPDDLFDAVLLDAPCSSTGTIRRHPDVLWTKGAEDIEKLARLQERLLRHALTLVKPGGELVFSNCSLDPIEGEEMIARVLADNPAWRIDPVDPADWPGLETAISPRGEFRTTPAMLPATETHAGGVDGFYAVRLSHGG
jgi:16S rRNA (cytosine967-C5)-methyltransferase